jgi:dTDP-4-dehydrorhamnose reductase
MKILVFGKDGQLGRAFQNEWRRQQLSHESQIYFVGRSECDLGDPIQLEKLLNDFAPDCIINAAAYTAVDNAEQESELVFAINAVAPELMAKYSANHGVTLLHFSTDYVFDGTKQGFYEEIDQTNPLSVYGKSKEIGEQAVVKAFDVTSNKNGQYAILRTSWVYGDGSNFIRTILRLAAERASLRVINDQFGAPTNTNWLAQLGFLLVLDGNCPRSFKSGIYHAAPRGETNWYQLACLTVRTAIDSGQLLQLDPSAIVAIPSSEYPLPAPRPMNSRLSTAKLQSELERLGLVSKLSHWNTPWDEQVSNYVKTLLKT